MDPAREFTRLLVGEMVAVIAVEPVDVNRLPLVSQVYAPVTLELTPLVT
jgi:hypothetical protein